MRKDSSENLSSVEKLLPEYELNIQSGVISIGTDKLMSCFVLEGMAYESESDNVIRNRFYNVNDYLISLGKDCGGSLGIWTHIVKREVKIDNDYKFKSEFINNFTSKYIEQFNGSGSKFFKVLYYITLVLKFKNLDDGVEKINMLNRQTLSVLRAFNCTLLSETKVSEDLYRCDNSEYLAFLLNAEDSIIPLSHTPIVESIPNSKWAFGYDVAEIRNGDTLSSKYMVNYVLKGYPSKTKMGMWDFLLSQPYEFILSQSFLCSSNQRSLKKIDSQLNKLGSVGDAAGHQLEELELGKALLASGETLFGDYQASLVIFGKSPEQAVNNGVNLTSEFLTAGGGVQWRKANREAIYTFMSILPASKYRPLSTIRSSNNLSCGFSLHNFSSGKAKGNPIGDGTAIMPVKTKSDGLFFLNTHYSDLNRNVIGQPIAGHGLILGATGAGKTTLEGTMALFVQRFDPLMFVIDYNRSTELYLRACGAKYFTLREGIDTGLNPFQIEEIASPELLQFLYRWVESCARDGQGDLPDVEGKKIKESVDAVMNMPLMQRRFSCLLQNIPQGSDLHIKLSKWCHSEGGKLAWAVDSPVNIFNPHEWDKVGFDTTVILEKDGENKAHRATEPLLATLFFYKDLMQKEGRLMLTIVEEFWMPCNFPLTQTLINKILKAGRMKGEFIWLVSQSPEDAVNCAIFSAIVQQTPTKILLPNPDAPEAPYLQIGLTSKEFNELIKLDKESRIFLIKQSGTSCFAKMDLFGFDDFLPIISGSKPGIALCEKIRMEMGTDDPDVWIPEFQRILREQRKS